MADNVNRLTRDLNIDNLTVRLIDFHGRRITNASDTIGNQDYVTKRQLDETVGSGGSGNATIVEDFTMTSTPYNVTVTAVPTVGKSLVVILIQDGTGGRYPAWPASCLNAPTAVYGAAGAKILVGFIEYGGFWIWDGRFVNGF